MQKNEYVESFTIHSYEVDMTNKATLQVICQYLQEAASNHADKLGFGMTWLLDNQKTWMLSRLKVSMRKYPGVGDQVIVRTWPSGAEKLHVLRDFTLETPEGDLLGSAVSSWVFMDLKIRRPVRPASDELIQFVPEVSDRALPGNPVKIKPAENPMEKTVFQVRYNDLDMNEHVNNVKYVEWLLECLEPEFRQKHIPTDFEINFLSEAVYGHKVSVHLEKRGNGFMHMITNDGGKEICRAETVWKVLE